LSLAGCGKTRTGQKARPPGLKPALIVDVLRGAEAPLFHVATRISTFFRSLLDGAAAFQLLRFGSYSA
jgi:hypothetical protein